MTRPPHGGHPPPHAETPSGNGTGQRTGVRSRVSSVGRAAGSLSRELRSTAADLGHALDLPGRVRRHPYAMMAAAVGMGYLLGGGLFSRTTARLLGLAGRVASLPVMRNELIGLAEAMISGRIDSDDAGPPSGSDIPSPS